VYPLAQLLTVPRVRVPLVEKRVTMKLPAAGPDISISVPAWTRRFRVEAWLMLHTPLASRATSAMPTP